jgi:hypothetical protein
MTSRTSVKLIAVAIFIAGGLFVILILASFGFR